MPIIDGENIELRVGQLWLAKLPGDHHVSTVYIHSAKGKTVSVSPGATKSHGELVCYITTDVVWVERTVR